MKFKKLLSIVMATAISVSMLAGCNTGADKGSAESNTPTENASDATAASTEPTDQSEEPVASGGDVKILTNVTGGKDDEEMVLFSKELSERTGLNVTMEKPSDYGAALIQKLQSGELYDLVYLGSNDLINLQQQGALLDITDRVKGSEIMQSNINPQERKDIEIDGKYFAGLNKMEVFTPVNANVVHLKKAGIDPTTIEPTLDGYYNVFKKLKESNTTENYYPFNVVLSDVWDMQPWFASVGVKGGRYEDADGKTYMAYAQDETAPVWEWLKKLYAEGLLDPSCVVDKTKDMRAKMGAASQLNSVDVDWVAWIGLHNANAEAEGVSTADYEIIALPGVKNPDGNYMFRKGNASLWGIPVNAPNPDGAFSILEFFATQEGGVLLSVGIENHDYVIKDGKMELTEIGMGHSKDHGAPFPIYKDFEAELGYNLGVEDAMKFAEFASIEPAYATEGDYKEVAGKWAVQIVKGEVEVMDGLAKMRAELVSRGVVDR